MTTEIKTKPARQGSVRLPPARVTQLRAIGAKLGISSVADVIGYLIGKEITAGVITSEIPGVHVVREDDTVLLSFGVHDPVKISCDYAKRIANDIRIRTQGSELLQGLRALVDITTPDDQGIRIMRRGTGVNIMILGQMQSFSPALADELADLIEATAA